MNRNWSSGGATPGGVQPRPAVYGAQYPPLQHAAAAAALQPSPSRSAPNGNKNTPASKLQDYENSVSDAWTTSVQLDDEQVMTAAQRVLAQHAAASREEEIMPPVGVTPAKNSRIQAMQRLAIQKGPLPSKGAAAEATPAPSLYPRLVDTSTEETTRSSSKGAGGDRDAARFERLRRALSVNGETEVDMGRLREDCWLGIAHRMRPAAWRILSGYMPTKKERREATLKMKRDEYWHYVEQYFHTRFQDGHSDTFRQISIDIPRMSPLIQLFQQKLVQEIFERILYIWAIRHPASGYVQGINDLVTPFFVVFLSEFVPAHAEVGSFDVSQLDIETQQLVEADSFWCVSSLLDAVLDNYTFAQPGIQRKVLHLSYLMNRVDPALYNHLKAQQVEYLQFAFRWMNNILMREMPLRATIRLWDTYLSEVNGFAQFHGYVCAAFLRTFSRQIQAEKDFQGIMILLQNLPTSTWGDQQICELTADAFSLMQVFDGTKVSASTS